MAISIDWQNKLVLSTASITDIVAFKDTIRDLEDDAEGVLYDAVISYKRLDLGGGAFFHGVDFINGYQLKFPTPGNYTVVGNIGALIVPVGGVYVDRTKAAAFATVSGGGGGLTLEQATKLDEVWKRLGLDAANPLVNTDTLISAGTAVQLLVTETSNTTTTTRL